MGKPIFFTEIDGTLLDLYGVQGSAGILERKYKGTHPTTKIGPPQHYDFEEAYGISHGEAVMLFDELWETPVPVYPGAVEFVTNLQNSGFRVLGVTMRATSDSQIACYRDTPDLGLDGLYIVKKLEEKAPLITRLSEGATCFYLEDRIQTAIDVSIKCTNSRVMLIDRPWNHSLDLCLEYDRVYSYAAASDGARFIHGRFYGEEVRDWRD